MGNSINKKNKIIPIFLEKGNNEINYSNCSICLEEFKNNSIKICCGHHYHSECILKWFDKDRSCPNCRIKYNWTIIKQEI